MGDDIELRAVEVIQDGLLQMDLWNNTKHEGYRVFINPADLFSMIGKSMQNNHDAFVHAFTVEEILPGTIDDDEDQKP